MGDIIFTNSAKFILNEVSDRIEQLAVVCVPMKLFELMHIRRTTGGV